MSFKNILQLSFVFIACLNPAFAHDLGVYSEVFSIDEVNLKELIAEELKSIDPQSINLQLKENAKSFGDHLALNILPKATKTQTIYHDPSIALSKNIIIRGQILYKKGTKINPLKFVRPTTNLLFFDGNDHEQIDFALRALKQEPYRLTLVLTQGNPTKLASKIHRPIYYAMPSIIERFKIESVPSLLGVGNGEYENHLAVTSFSKPYSLSTINTCWHGCPKNKT